MWFAGECREATKAAATVAGMSTMSIWFGACRAKLVDHLPSSSGHFTCFSECLGMSQPPPCCEFIILPRLSICSGNCQRLSAHPWQGVMFYTLTTIQPPLYRISDRRVTEIAKQIVIYRPSSCYSLRRQRIMKSMRVSQEHVYSFLLESLYFP